MKNSKGYGRKKNDGRNFILTKQEKKKIINMAKTGNYFAREIKIVTRVNCSVRTV